jgi:hypothetical protein
MQADQINSPDDLLKYLEKCLIDFENGRTSRNKTLFNIGLAINHLSKIVDERENRKIGEALLSQQNFKNMLDSGNMYLIT